jgi:secondary thiamine-phosphate synthase enzyme
MSKSSIVTTRSAPPEGVSATGGGMFVRAELVTVETIERLELIDLTAQIQAFVRTSGVREGVVSVWSMHTTFAIFINEAQAALHADIKQFLGRLVERDASWLHNDPEHSDCDRMNADAHLRAILLGHGLTLQISAGDVVLGQWQRVLSAELDGPRSRTVRVQVMGLA